MKHTYLILILLTLVTYSSCHSSSTFFGTDELSLSDKLEKELSANPELKLENIKLEAAGEIQSFYKSNEFTPLWITDSSLNDKGNEMHHLVNQSYQFGLLPEFYHHEAIQSTIDSNTLIKTEFLLSNAYCLMITHLNVGFLDTMSFSYSWKKDSVNFDFVEALSQVKNANEVVEVVTSYQPKSWEYTQLQSGLAEFVNTHELSNYHTDIPNFKEDSAACYQQAKMALLQNGFIDSLQSQNDSIFMVQLKAFQKFSGLKDDGVVGKWTAHELALSNMDRFYKGMISLEKWRWKKENEFPSRYIRVNIPAYQLKLWDDNKIVRTHRVIVGAHKTKTPEFHAQLKTIVTNPYWHVPYSIASTEILYGARKDTAYFSKHNYKLFKSGEEVNPKSVDWTKVTDKSFTYRVRQEGGGSNSLGRVKFLFPNKHSVFIHDTPGKYLFSNDMRAYSHGCVRLQDPFDLAKTVLQLDGNEIESDTIDSRVRRGIQDVFSIKSHIEVFIEYYTASGDSSGQIQFYPDVYDRDKKYLNPILKEFITKSDSALAVL